MARTPRRRVPHGALAVLAAALTLAAAACVPPHEPHPPAGYASVGTGFEHTCAVTGAGGVECWGHGSSGQLGNNSTANSSVPVKVSTLSSGVAAVVSGAAHSCALTTGGGVKCWGSNAFGALGNNATTNSSVPVNVVGLTSGVIAIATGGDASHTCAITSAHGLRCWGNNNYGQLGNGANANSGVPVDVTGLSAGVASVAVGQENTCARTTAGGAKCWGSNGYGQLGNGSTTGSSVPVDVSGLTSGVASVSVGSFNTCGLTTAGGVKCWGSNVQSSLGNGSTADSSVPVTVSGLGSGVGAISSGRYQSCALTTGGGLKCWGYNLSGQLGDASNTNHGVPVDVSGLTSGVSSVSAGFDYTCARTTAAAVKCWGLNSFGQLGNNSTANSNVPVTVVQN